MVLLVFLVDTSASMNQRTYLGTSYLDLAKGAVESFLKIRARDTNNIRGGDRRGDRYMLVTYDEMNKSIKAGWRENLEHFLTELKNLTGYGLSNIGRALKETFDLLNINRFQSGLDKYGMGRNPYYLEPAVVLLLTDGCSALDIDGIINEITLPTHDLLPGGELTKELYRWDQRLFTVHLKLPGIFSNPVNNKNSTSQHEDMPLSNLCDQTGGKLYTVGSQKNLMQILESVAQKITIPGVIINFDKYGPDPEVLQEDHLKNEEEMVKSAQSKNLEKSSNGPVNSYIGGTDKDFNFKAGNLNGFINGQALLPTPVMPPTAQRTSQQNTGKPQNKSLHNGVIEGHDKVKTEGIASSSSPMPGIPVRGNEEQWLDGNVLSPNPSSAVSTAWHNQRRMIFVRGSVGHWPIPESFWPESSGARLPPRDSQPVVKFVCKPVDAMVIDNMPFDKYELEPSPLTQYILERRQPNAAWQTFVSGSSLNSELGYPFGYLKAATNLQCVNFFVMPYNYPVVMPLLDELFKIHKGKPTPLWRQNFHEYLQTVPAYYYGPLRTALRRMGAPSNLIPDHFDGSLSYSIVTYLKKLKHQLKAEADRLNSSHNQRNKVESSTGTQTIPRVPQLIDGKLRDFKDLLIQKTTNYHKKDGDLSSNNSGKEAPFDKRSLPNYTTTHTSKTFRNPFDIRQNEVIERVAMMRLNFFHSSTMGINKRMVGDDDSQHGVSIAAMGNFQEHVRQNKPLREVDPSQVRLHTFGNPFKLKQDQIIAVDEADVSENIQIGQNARKRNGEIMNSLQKGKRKRSDTPPPSRRPSVGTAPNTPPPRLPGKLNDENDKRNDIFKSISDNKGILISDNKGVLKDLATASLEDSFKGNNTTNKDTEKKPSVNKQLRKLQLMHRNKKENHELSLNDTKLDEISEYIEGSPILSILRTSLEEPEDKDNDELLIINENNTNKNGIGNSTYSYNEERSSSASTSSRSSSSALNKTPVSSVMTPLNVEDLFVNHSKDALAKIYTQLHSRKVVRTRLSVWQAIRERTEFSRIADLIRSLPVDIEAKLMFTLNLIREAEKFQLNTLEKKFKKLLNEL